MLTKKQVLQELIGQPIDIGFTGGSTHITPPDPPSSDDLGTDYSGEIVEVGDDVIKVRLETGNTEYHSIAHIHTIEVADEA